MKTKNSLNAIVAKVLKTVVIAFIFICGDVRLFAQSYSWHMTTNSIYDYTYFDNLHFISSNTGWMIHAYGVIFKTTDGGYNWAKRDSVNVGSFTGVQFINDETGWVSSRSNNMFKTTNGGNDLVRITNFPNPVPSGLESVHILDDLFIYGCGRYDAFANFVKSSDGGNTWTTQSLTQYATGLSDCYFFDQNTGMVAGCMGTGNQREAVILFTSDGGQTWATTYESNRERESVQVLCFVDDLTGYASVETISSPEKYVLKTTNGGLNWTALSFPNYPESGIGFMNANTGWVGGDFNPTYGTTDGGVTWFNANIGQFINGFQFFGDTLGYACGQYVYKYERTNNLIQTSSEIPDGFELVQNFPNPFNPSTKINYRLQVAGVTRLVVIDLMGREVAELVNEYHSPGSYEYKFDASNLSSGVYYYKITAGEFVSVKKMLLVK